MLRVATVLSAREWEARFVAAARDSAAVRLVLRAYLPDEVSARADGIDVVIAGSETPWVTPTRVAAWRRLGLRVVGVHPELDKPAMERLRAGGADLLFHDRVDPDQIVREVRLLDGFGPVERSRIGRIVAVTGTRGGPGRTEVASALAWSARGRNGSALVDADLGGPSLAVRFGLPPRPDLSDCVDAALRGADLVPSIQVVSGLRVIPGPLRASGIRPETAADVSEALAANALVIVDSGPWREAGAAIGGADHVVFVVEATPIGIVRASQIVDGWAGPEPNLVLNKVRPKGRVDAVAALRRWSGLEPAAVVRHRAGIAQAAAKAGRPHRGLISDLRPLLAGLEA